MSLSLWLEVTVVTFPPVVVTIKGMMTNGFEEE